MISQAMVYGDRKPYLTALITLDTKNWHRGRSSGDQRDEPGRVCCDQRVRNLVADIVKEKNQHLASFETIKRFTILSQDFSQEAEKSPRPEGQAAFVSEKYRDLLEKMYA